MGNGGFPRVVPPPRHTNARGRGFLSVCYAQGSPGIPTQWSVGGIPPVLNVPTFGILKTSSPPSYDIHFNVTAPNTSNSTAPSDALAPIFTGLYTYVFICYHA